MVRLTPEQVQFYRDNGYILLKGAIKGKDLEVLSREYDNLFKRKNESKTESAWVGRVHNHRISDSPYTVSSFDSSHINYAGYDISHFINFIYKYRFTNHYSLAVIFFCYIIFIIVYYIFIIK